MSSSLEAKVHKYAMTLPKQMVGQADLQAQFPNTALSDIGNAINNLSKKNLIKTMDLGKQGIKWQAVSKGEAKKLASLDDEEGLVYRVIEQAGRDAIWTMHIRTQTNLHQTVVNKVLKALEGRNEIKVVKSIKFPTRKLYMLFHLTPSVEMTGGPWFTDHELDTEFIKQLLGAVLSFIKQRSFPKVKNHPTAVFPPSHASAYPTAAQIATWIRKAQISTTELDVGHVRVLLDVLVFDGEVEALPAGGGGGSGGGEWRRKISSGGPSGGSSSAGGKKSRSRTVDSDASDDSDDDASEARRARRRKKAKLREMEKEKRRRAERKRRKERERKRRRKGGSPGSDSSSGSDNSDSESASGSSDDDRRRSKTKSKSKRSSSKSRSSKRRAASDSATSESDSDSDPSDALEHDTDSSSSSADRAARKAKKAKKAARDKKARSRSRSKSRGAEDSDDEVSDADSIDEDKAARKKAKKKKQAKRVEVALESSDSDDSDKGSRRGRRKKGRAVSSSEAEEEGERPDLADFEDDEGDALVYRAVRPEQVALGFTAAPCGRCPVFELCNDSGPINPDDCQYYGEWLEQVLG